MPRRSRASARVRMPSISQCNTKPHQDPPLQMEPRANVPPGTPTPARASVEQDAAESRPETPQDEDDADSAGQQSDEPQPASERSSPRPVQSVPRKRRLGRPPKNRPPDWDTPELEQDARSETGTPQKRRRGRPSAGGFRGRPRGGPSHVTRVPIDKQGNTLEVIDDEVALPEDPEGETKVDKQGNLLGGRDYRVRVFTITGRGGRLYMLSTEPARCTGFRDSYLFFTKHMQLYKIIIDDNEKRDLISRDIIPHSYKGRAIGVVTARSVFREFGARIVIGGRKIMDDYHAQAARDRGDVEGELADPLDKLPAPGEAYNKNQYVAWHGASSVYHTGQPSVPLPNGKTTTGKKKVTITSDNWMVEHARAASRFNSELTALRLQNLNGVYDIHTNLMLYPKHMQPTHAKWVEVTSETPESDNLPGMEHLSLNTGNTAPVTGSNRNNDSNPAGPSTEAPATTIFPPVPPHITRNYLVVDTVYQSPPMSGLGIPGPDGDTFDVGPTGLPIVSQEILDELPPECRKAFEEAKAVEKKWKETWGTETQDGHRGKLKIGFNGLPV